MIPKIIITTLLVIVYLNTNITLQKENHNVSKINWNPPIVILQEKPIATLSIRKINLQERLYSKKSKLNTVERNITFLPSSDLPDKDNSLIIIAAHSGTGALAYFKDLDLLSKNDIISIDYKEKKYIYIVSEILIQEKTGTIEFQTDIINSHLILTTCMPHQKGKQLIIISKKRESI